MHRFNAQIFNTNILHNICFVQYVAVKNRCIIQLHKKGITSYLLFFVRKTNHTSLRYKIMSRTFYFFCLIPGIASDESTKISGKKKVCSNICWTKACCLHNVFLQ